MRKELPRKTCKCGKPALINRRICYSCYLAGVRAKREAYYAKQKERKAKKKDKQVNSFKYLHKLAWQAFSKCVRQGGMDSNGMNFCFTCGVKKHWKELQCGHFHHNRLDFSPINCRPQCPRCNTYLSGNLGIYGTKLAEEIGSEGMKQLLLEANTKIYTCKELKQIIEKYA